MFKRCFFAVVCFVLLGMALYAGHVASHADDTPFALPGVSAIATTLASQAMHTHLNLIPDTSSLAQPASLGGGDPSIWPAPATDGGPSVLYQQSGQQADQNATKTVVGQFPATPSFVVHASCYGTGSITIQVNSSIFDEQSCPQKDSMNQYTVSPAPAAYDTVLITAQGAIVWRVIVTVV